MAWRRRASMSRKFFSTSAGSMPRWRSFSSSSGRLSRTNPRSSIRKVNVPERAAEEKCATDYMENAKNMCANPRSVADFLIKLLARGFQGTQVGDNGFGVVLRVAILGHRRTSRKAVRSHTGRKKFDCVLIAPARKSGDVSRPVRPVGHREQRFETQRRTLKVLLFDELAFFIHGRVAVSTCTDVLHQILASRLQFRV